MEFTLNGESLKHLGAGAYKEVYLAPCRSKVWKVLYYGSLDREIAALWKAFEEGLPVALPLEVDYDRKAFSQRFLWSYDCRPQRCYQEWNEKYGNKFTDVFDISDFNVGFCPVEERIMIHDCCWGGAVDKYYPVPIWRQFSQPCRWELF